METLKKDMQSSSKNLSEKINRPMETKTNIENKDETNPETTTKEFTIN